MGFKLRVGAPNMPQEGDEISVFLAGTATLVTGLVTADSNRDPLSNPFTVPASGWYGFEPPTSDRVDVYWNDESKYLAQDINARDITLDFSAGGKALVATTNAAAITIGFTYPAGEKPADGAEITVPMTIPLRFPANLTASRYHGSDNPTANPVTLSVKKNGSEFGTLQVTSNGTPTFAGSETSFAEGDLLSWVFPGSADATWAGMAVMLKGERV